MIDMTVPKFMDGWCEEETTQEQYDWLKAKAEKLAELEKEISPKLQEAWEIMSELQSVVDENQEWADEIETNALDDSYLYCYAHGTLEILDEVDNHYGIWNPDEDELEQAQSGSDQAYDTWREGCKK